MPAASRRDSRSCRNLHAGRPFRRQRIQCSRYRVSVQRANIECHCRQQSARRLFALLATTLQPTKGLAIYNICFWACRVPHCSAGRWTPPTRRVSQDRFEWTRWRHLARSATGADVRAIVHERAGRPGTGRARWNWGGVPGDDAASGEEVEVGNALANHRRRSCTSHPRPTSAPAPVRCSI